jgi:F-type H+-transporting ATPase subunit gamma
MPTLRDIRKKLKAIAGTKKITSAMKMVAAAKLRKVQDRMINFRPYAIKMNTVLTDLARVTEGSAGHPLLTRRPRRKVEVLVISSDRGLCGAFNSNILRVASQHIDALKKQGIEVGVSTVGRKARDFFKRREIVPRKIWIGISGKLNFAHAQDISQDLIETYTAETTDEFVIIYNEFKSLIMQKVTVARLLPIGGLEAEGAEAAASGTTVFAPFLYEPSREVLFERLLPKYIEIQVYHALLESQAAEEAARMAAMENASKNCEDLIISVTLQANKVRQAGITKELMDIVGGVEALKQ